MVNSIWSPNLTVTKLLLVVNSILADLYLPLDMTNHQDKIKKIAFNYIFSTELRCWVFTFTTDLKSWWYPYPYETFGSRQIDQNYFSPKSIILRKSWQIHKKGFCSLFEMPLPFYNEFFHSCYSPPLSSKYSLEKVYFEPMHL